MPHDIPGPGREPDPADDDPEVMIEEFLDCTGKKRRFQLQRYAFGTWLDATELLDGEPVGMRLILKMDEHGHLRWGDMRSAIRRRLAERDLAVDPDTDKLEILNNLVRAHIHHAPAAIEDDDDGPMLIVDDRRITWRQLGQMLEAYEGWDLRLEIVDATAG